jgi:hypothetical protein
MSIEKYMRWFRSFRICRGKQLVPTLPICFALFMFFALSYIHQGRFNFGTPNARLDLLHAIVEHGTLRIDAYATNTADKALYEGHLYSPKPPGTAALALPAFAAAAGLSRLGGVGPDSASSWLVTSWAACAFSQALPATLGALALWFWLLRFVQREAALWTVLALFLGGMPLPYSTMLFSHAGVVGLLCIAIWSLDLLAEAQAGGLRGSGCAWSSPLPNLPGMRPHRSVRALLAGFCVGLAVASEYTCGIVAVALVLWVVFRSRSRAAWFVLGCIPPLVLIPLYNWAAMGSPFRLPYTHSASFPAMREGFYSVGWPDARIVLKLLLSPERGLFFWSSFLLMAGIGYWVLVPRSATALWLTYIVPAIDIIVLSGRAWDWQAGQTFGPRYLAPLLPLLALPCAMGVQRCPGLGVALAIYSIALATTTTLTDACLPYHPGNPFSHWVLPHLLGGRFSHTLGSSLLGMPQAFGIALYVAVLVGGIIGLRRLARIADRADVKDNTAGTRFTAPLSSLIGNAAERVSTDAE